MSRPREFPQNPAATAAGMRVQSSLRSLEFDVETAGLREAPTTLALVRRTASGGVVLRYVRGEELHPEGSYVGIDIPLSTPPVLQPQLGLPCQRAAGPKEISQPTAVRHPVTARSYVAAAHFPASGGPTYIDVIGATHPTMLTENVPATLERATLIDSPVTLAHLHGQLLLAWQEGDVLKVTTSVDGVAWSSVRDSAALGPGELFALWSEGHKLYLASTVHQRTGAVIRESTDAVTWVPTLGVPELRSGTPLGRFGRFGQIVGLSLVLRDNYFYLAYCEARRLRIFRFPKGSAGSPTNAVVRVAHEVRDPHNALHGVTIHLSPYGWALQYVESSADPAVPGGRRYFTLGHRSQDGLDYSGTQWSYAVETEFMGGTAMFTTAVPMPWIIKGHDSGRPTDGVYNFVITADGYTYSDKNRLYEMCKEMTANIVERAPFFYNQDLFNVWIVITYSRDAGLSSSATDIAKDTIFGGYLIPPNTRVTRHDGMKHARLVIAGDPSAANFYGWVFFTESGGILPSDFSGVAICEADTRSEVAIHEFMHTYAGAGGFALGDHERRNQAGQNVNKSFDRSLDPAGTHAWQSWFVFDGPSSSRLVEVTEAYRNGLLAWVAAGNDPYPYSAAPYSDDPTSPHYVDARSLFQVGLVESHLPDVPDLSASPLYRPLRCCFMNSLLEQSATFCPICSQAILQHLSTIAGVPFSATGFQGAPGTYLEFQINNDPCVGTEPALAFDLNDLVRIGNHVLSPADFAVYQATSARESIPALYHARADLGQWVAAGSMATLTFQRRSTGQVQLWIPGIQVVNGKGARCSLQPADVTLQSGERLLDRLHAKHYSGVWDNCAYQYWDLSEGDLTLTFTPK